MGGDFPFLDIILLALVAAFLVLRLRSVLGRRDGHEPRTADPFKAQQRETAEAEDKVIRLPDRGADNRFDDDEVDAEPDTLAGGLARIGRADRSFDPDEFVSGARIAFEMILTAFAAGDTKALKSLLSPEVFANFEHSIRERAQAGETLDLNLVGIRGAEIVEASLEGRMAQVTVKFTSEQISVIRDEHGDVIEGEADDVTDVVDFWSFARDTSARDPNWLLIATRSAE